MPDKKIPFDLFCIYDARENYIMDFIVPRHRRGDLLDYQWEVEAEPAVQGFMARLGYHNVLAVYEKTFMSSFEMLTARNKDTYIYAMESDQKSKVDQ